jgi:hypothetical protein
MIILELGMLRTFDSDRDGKLRILPKEQIKQYIGHSPDWSDNFLMRMFWETMPVKQYDQDKLRMSLHAHLFG